VGRRKTALHQEVKSMKQHFTASITQEEGWFVAQCLEVDVASQGESEDEALANLREALELYFEPPTPTLRPEIRAIEVETGAA
jgi:predicted RNase H-like HicB family nuclease